MRVVAWIKNEILIKGNGSKSQHHERVVLNRSGSVLSFFIWTNKRFCLQRSIDLARDLDTLVETIASKWFQLTVPGSNLYATNILELEIVQR